MHKHLRYGVLENLSQVRRIRVGQLWGVALLATPIAWLSPVVFFALHFLLNLLNTWAFIMAVKGIIRLRKEKKENQNESEAL